MGEGNGESAKWIPQGVRAVGEKNSRNPYIPEQT